jgi:hypothetical protein
MHLQPAQRYAIEVLAVGLSYSPSADEKVRRWLLNALARIGREAHCMAAVQHLLANYPHEPQTTAAGIATVYKLSKLRPPEEVLRGVAFDPQMVALAALQHAPAEKLDLSSLPLSVEHASGDLLRLALVLVGIDRAPPNMLNPNYDNAAMIKALGQHHDDVVSQYTVWAVTENPKLGVKDLGIDLKDLPDAPPNVRSWVYRVLSMTPEAMAEYFDLVIYGISEQSREARHGLASGLRGTYLDILEPHILEWALTEDDLEISQLILDHVVRQANRSPQYARLALEFYEKEPSGSGRRARMEVAAENSHLYIRFRQLAAEGVADLFGGATYVSITNNIQGGVQGGAVSLTGHATNTGPTTIQHYTGETRQAILTELSNAERALHESELDEGIKKGALDKVSAAKEDPSPNKVQRAVDAIKGAGAIAEAGMALAPYAAAIASAAGLG